MSRPTSLTLVGRRAFLWSAALLTAIGPSAAEPPCAVATDASTAAAPVELRPNPQRNLMRVRMEMDVKGNVNVPENPLVSRKSELTLPLKSTAVFDYEERYLRPADANERSEVPVVERFYHEASNASELNRQEATFQLRDSVRHVHVRRSRLPETIYAIDDYFTGDELSLLRVPVSMPRWTNSCRPRRSALATRLNRPRKP